MALTLTEAAKLSNDILLQGVIETVIKDSPVLQTLPFIEIVGNGLTYNREKAAPTVGFYSVGDTWAERHADVHPVDGDALHPGRRRGRGQLSCHYAVQHPGP